MTFRQWPLHRVEARTPDFPALHLLPSSTFPLFSLIFDTLTPVVSLPVSIRYFPHLLRVSPSGKFLCLSSSVQFPTIISLSGVHVLYKYPVVTTNESNQAEFPLPPSLESSSHSLLEVFPLGSLSSLLSLLSSGRRFPAVFAFIITCVASPVSIPCSLSRSWVSRSLPSAFNAFATS